MKKIKLWVGIIAVLCLVIGAASYLRSGSFFGNLFGEKVLSQAPDITISNSTKELVLPFGPGDWEYDRNMEERSGYTACGAYPPDGTYTEERTLPNDGSELKVSFDEHPDTLRVTIWELDTSKEKVTYSEAQVLSDVQEKNGAWYFTVPEGKEIVCEVFATWDREKYRGNSSYCVLMELKTTNYVNHF